MIKVEIT